MAVVKIIAGTLKGRIIPFSGKKFGDADITPQKVKGALFSHIGEDLSGKGFLDLYACSGQVGLEALSRGADPVFMNEPDRKRYDFIRSCLRSFPDLSEPVLLSMKDRQALSVLSKRGISFEYIFADPPYSKEKGPAHQYSGLLCDIGNSGVLARAGLIIIQHFTGNIMDEGAGPYSLVKTMKYGNTSLSLYR
jgi:16S rRNA (guanine(966)-N(2))-methyltransferase RsmD